MSALKVYADAMSPPCRAVMLLLAANDVAHEFVEISLKEGENRTNQEFMKTNPNKQVPSISDDGFAVFESVAILHYICQKYALANNWYPTNLQTRTKVEEALAWFAGNLRCGCFFENCVVPIKYKKPRDEAKCATSKEKLRNSLDIIENYFLNGRKYISGDEISIADLLFVAEVTQYWASNNYIYKGRPNMERWMELCQTVLAPHFDTVSRKLYAVREAGIFHYSIDVGQIMNDA